MHSQFSKGLKTAFDDLENSRKISEIVDMVRNRKNVLFTEPMESQNS